MGKIVHNRRTKSIKRQYYKEKNTPRPLKQTPSAGWDIMIHQIYRLGHNDLVEYMKDVANKLRLNGFRPPLRYLNLELFSEMRKTYKTSEFLGDKQPGDNALHQSKKSGKNKVTAAEPPSKP